MQARWLSALAATLVAGAFVGAAPAELSDDVFDSLETELEHRRDIDLVGELDRAGRKQLKAVVKCLDWVGEPDDGLASVVKTAGKVDRKLGKAFKDELESPGAASLESHEIVLGDLLVGLAADLHGRVEARISIVAGIPRANDKVASKVEKLEGKAAAQFGKAEAFADDGNRRRQYKFLFKTMKFLDKASKILADNPPDDEPTEPGSTFTGSVDGGSWTASGVDAALQGDQLGFVLNGPATGEPSESAQIQVSGVDGTGSYSLAEASGHFMRGEAMIPLVSGTLTITTFNSAAGVIEGTLVAGFSDGETTIALTDGTFLFELQSSEESNR